MDIFEQGLIAKVRFSHRSIQGEMNLEDVMNLKPEKLNDIAVGIDECLAGLPKRSYLASNSAHDAVAEELNLKRSLVLHILERKQQEQLVRDNARLAEAKRKADLQIAAAALHLKKAESFNSMSIEELEAIVNKGAN